MTAGISGFFCVEAVGFPALRTRSMRWFVGNAAFRVGVCNGYPSALSMLAVSVASASTPVGPCTVALGGSVLLLGGTFTDNFGYASEAVPIPANPGLVGVTFYGQYLVWAPNGPFLGFAQLSQGLAITIG